MRRTERPDVALDREGKIMNTNVHVWNPQTEDRQYQASGSRSTFNAKWDPHLPHETSQTHGPDQLQLMMDSLAHEERARWLKAFENTHRYASYQ